MNLNNSTSIQRKTNWRPLLFELFVALSLFAAYFFLVRNFFAYGNPMSGNVFMAGSEKLYRLDQPIMGEHWNGRLSGLLLSGALMDYSLNENGAGEAQIGRLSNVFGLYHACWLLMLFVVIIFALRQSLFINLGIFAGLMYDFSPTSGPYFYPWDMPAMLFFTLAVLLFERRQMWLMALAICVGAFFKETVLVCALLYLFASQWKPKKRILVLAGIVAVFVLGKKLMMSRLDIDAPMLSISNALSLHGAFSPVTLFGNLIDNFKALFSPSFNSVLFVNAGTLIAVLALCWQKRFLPYMTVIVAFLAGLFVIAQPPGVREVRDFIEILPLSLVLLSVLWAEYSKANPADGPPAESTGVWPVRETFPMLFPIVIAAAALSTSIAAWQYYIIYEDLQPANQAQSPLGKYVYQSGKPVSLEAVSEWFQNGYVDSRLKLAIISQRDHRDADAIAQYQSVLAVDTNSLYALNNLATLLATDSDARLRDGGRAMQLAERACQLSQNNEPALLYTLAAAYAEAGRFNDAVTTAQKARALALVQGQTEMAKDNDPLLDLYKSGHAFHQQPAATP
jgi:hypothetical protein